MRFRPTRCLLGLVAALILVGCGVTASSQSSSTAADSAVSSQAIGSSVGTLTVTVPNLGTPSAALVATSTAVPSASKVPASGAAISTAVAPAVSTTPAASTNSLQPSAPLASSQRAQTPAPSAGDTAQINATKDETSPADSSSTGASTEPATAESTVAVSLADCPGCRLLATRAHVVGTLAAALVTTPAHRTALLALSSTGAVKGVINVLYGSTFVAPVGGQLPCDSAGRCIVIGQQANGAAILSAFELTGLGTWNDLSNSGAYASDTSAAQTVDLDGELGFAVQDQAAGKTVWAVYAWDANSYSIVGCEPADGPIDQSVLALSSCLS